MDANEIKELVMLFQRNTERVHVDQMYARLKETCKDELDRFSTEFSDIFISRIVRNYMSCNGLKKHNRIYSEQDFMQSFYSDKLMGILKNYRENENQSFLSYFGKSVKNHCHDIYRKTKNEKRNISIYKDEEDDREYIDELQQHDSFREVHNRSVYEKALKIMCPLLDSITKNENLKQGKDIKMILAYHFRVFLCKVIENTNHDYEELLHQYHGKLMVNISESIENGYSEYFNTQTSYMERISKFAEDKMYAEHRFMVKETPEGDIGEMKKKVADWVKEVGKSLFKRHGTQMIKFHEELVEAKHE